MPREDHPINPNQPPTGAIKTAVEALLDNNADNLADPTDDYAKGYHDALVDVLLAFNIPTDEKHFD